jgi:hypothetical protein
MIESLIASDAIDNLLANGNIPGAIVQIYIEKIGSYAFYGLIFLGLFGAFYLRRQSIIPLIAVCLILFASLLPIIPTPALGLILAIIGIGIGGIFYMIFVRGRQ